MIKRLQLRGISRNPSDRYTEDGGCAESLNVFIDNDETAPALKPVVVNTDASGMFPTQDWGHNWEAVFIHKTPNYERAIIRYVENLSTKLGTWNGSGCDEFMRLDIGETFIRCINLGNSLGVVTTNGTYWVLMKDESYQYMGKTVPFPAFTFANVDVPASSTPGEEVILETHREGYASQTGNESYQKKTGFDEDHLTVTWEDIDIAMAKNAKQGVFNRQQFSIFALRLFDGTRIISTPVLLCPGFSNPFSTHYSWVASNPIAQEGWTVKFNMAYKIFFRLDEEANFFGDWEDVVDSFEIYLSPQINPDRTKSSFDNYTITKSGNSATNVEGDLILGEGGDSILKQYLDASNFYRVYSEQVKADTMSTLRSGIILDTKDYMTTDSLVTAGIRLDTLSDMKHYEIGFDRATLYNHKVVASGITEKVKLDMHNPIAKYYLNTTIMPYTHPTYSSIALQSPSIAFRMTFYLRDSSGRSFSVKAMNKGSEYFFFKGETIDGKSMRPNGYGMIFCPDARAFAVDIQALSGDPTVISAGGGNIIGSTTLSLSSHPYLDCAYWYGDIEKELLSYCTQSAAYTPGQESYMDDKPNKVYMSEMDNPFVFPVASRYTLNSRVLGHAIATAALSEGQFGQFPIYVFTEDGIWAMESASDGTIVSSKPMSREVCNNPDSITPIDNAVVFTTEKTVMLVSGSQITDISPFMNGRHYKMDLTSREAQLIGGGDWSPFLSTMSDDTHFMDFMDEAQIGYDYKGNRLVFINRGETFQYVYMLRTNTWHKMYGDGFPLPLRFTYLLNAYPDTYVNVKTGNYQQVWNLSNKLDVTSSESMKGVIVTRPFDLGEPDVRKALRDIRIRGRFNRNDVRYILLGSMDNEHWGVLPSLRGGSYKWFKLVLLTNLSPTERISWIDVDYDTRMTNRFR